MDTTIERAVAETAAAMAGMASVRRRVTDGQVAELEMRMTRNGFDFGAQGGRFRGLLRPMLEGGIMLKGAPGVGKSYFFYCAGIPCLSMKIAQVKPFAELDRALMDHMDDDILIDDLGAGDDGGKRDYGTGINLLEYILEVRGDTQRVTHMTTNLTEPELRKRYGDDRIMDRLKELVTVFDLAGCESLRGAGLERRRQPWTTAFFKPKPWRKCIRVQCPNYTHDGKCLKGSTEEPKGKDCRYQPGLDWRAWF